MSFRLGVTGVWGSCLGLLLAGCLAHPDSHGPREPLGPRRQSVHARAIRVADLPAVAAGGSAPGEPATTLADPAVRTVELTTLAGTRRVDVVVEGPSLGHVTLGDSSAWHSAARGERAPIRALCSPHARELGVAMAPARWLTARPSESVHGAVDLRLGEGAFDGKRCALLASGGGAITAAPLDADLPAYAFRSCERPCGDGAVGTVVVLLPRIAFSVIDRSPVEGPDAGARGPLVRTGPFTMLELPLRRGTSIGLLGRVRPHDAAAFREDAGLRARRPRRDLDVTIELTQSAADDSAIVAIFVSRGLDVPESEQTF